jgi:hypothetical protein
MSRREIDRQDNKKKGKRVLQTAGTTIASDFGINPEGTLHFETPDKPYLHLR